MTLELNAEQRAIVECNENAVAAAGAGSGKTTVLASRYLRLVTENAIPVERILCLTFTKKAAGEMWSRIYHAVADTAANPNGRHSAKAASLASRARNDFYAARIQTLDSYCAGLVRAAAPRYGLSPDFTEDMEKANALIDEAALPFVISSRGHPALRALYHHKKPDEIARDFFASPVKEFGTIENPADFSGSIYTQIEYILHNNILETYLSAVNEALESFSGFARESGLNLKEMGLNAARIDITGEELAGYFSAIQASDEYTYIETARSHHVYKKIINCLTALYPYMEIKLNVKGMAKKTKACIQDIRAAFMPLSAFLVFCAQAASMLSLSYLQTRFQESVIDRKRREGALSFSDTAHLAKKILLEQKDIRQNEKEMYDAVIIDEFQDNNENQKELLFLIAEKKGLSGGGVPSAAELEENKLLFVGDQKQSIYRFRGADVSVFRALQSTFTRVYSLSANYRSDKKLIGVFNALFGGTENPYAPPPLKNNSTPELFNAAPVFSVFIPRQTGAFPPQNNAFPPFEAVYEPLTAGRKMPAEGAALAPPQAAAGGGVFTVSLIPCYASSQSANLAAAGAAKDAETGGFGEANDGNSLLTEESAAEKEAAYVAEKIHSLLLAGWKARDIAILTRSHSKEYLFEKALRARDIFYINENRSALIGIDPVHDLLAALRLPVYPMDALCYASYLRSPFAGLSLAGTSAVMSHFSIHKARPFSADAAAALDNEDTFRFENGARVYNAVLNKSASCSIAELISYLWYDTGYRYEVEWHKNTAVYRGLFELLFALAVKADSAGMSLALWTDKIKTLQKTSEFRRAAHGGDWLENLHIPSEREGAVSLLTIHKSKGLEFPIVFITGAGNRGRYEQSGDVHKTASFGICVNPPLPFECAHFEDGKYRRNYFFELGKKEAQAKSTAELRRLFYVAATRARDAVFVTGILPCSKDIFKNISSDTPLSEIIQQVYKSKLDSQNKKNADGELDIIEGDSIIHDNTILGLLLPALALRTGERLFSLERIGDAAAGFERGGEGASPAFAPNTRAGLRSTLERLRKTYQTARILETPVIRPLHRAVTSFTDIPFPVSFEERCEYNGPAEQAAFALLDGINTAAVFTAAAGDAAHIAVGALLKNETFILPPRIAVLLENDRAGEARDALKEAAAGFLLSPLGKRAAAAPRREIELPFRMAFPLPQTARESPADDAQLTADGAQLVNGVMDLVFEDEGGLTVVDFKTDRVETPETHAPQMFFYHYAARKLWKKECRVFLYYLRTGRAVEMSLLPPA